MANYNFVDSVMRNPVKIHICKDRTLSARTQDMPVWNRVAMAVFSVPTFIDAERLFVLVGTNMGIHPDPRYQHDPWWKLFNGVAGNRPELELEDLQEVHDYLQKGFKKIQATRKVFE